MTTSDKTEPDVVAVGLIEDPFITSGPWVVHPYWNSLPPGSGVPLHDTPCKPEPVRKSCDRPANSPTHTRFTANNLTGRRLGPIDTPAARRLMSLLLSGGLGFLGTTAIKLALAHAVPIGGLVAWLTLAAAVCCGVLLVLAALIDTAEKDRRS